MNDVYEINVAKARLREAYNAGNVDLLLMAFADEFTDMSSGKPSFFGADAKSVFRMRMTNLFEQHQATLSSPSSLFAYFATAAFDYGWHSLTLTPREGGESTTTRKRYFETWQKTSSGEWKINLYIDNVDVAPMMPDADILIQ
jgi:ketosteroid isomerase-like protein